MAVEEALNSTPANNATAWPYMKELPQEEGTVELTIKDISEGKGKGVPPHLIRIKDE